MQQYSFSMPPTLLGTETEQLVQLHRYLFRLNEQLTQAINSESLVVQEQLNKEVNAVTVKVAELESSLSGQYNNAKALIIKTAEDVQHEMEKIELELAERYVARSEWGTYREEVTQEIEATAKSIVQSYDYDSKIDAVGTEFDTYRIQSRGYIQSGIIGFDDAGYPIYGVAIGRDLANRTVTVGNTTYETIDMDRNLATYTSDRITFWQNGVAVAYISNSEMVISKIKILTGFRVGEDKWEISHTRGFAIKWVGGDV